MKALMMMPSTKLRAASLLFLWSAMTSVSAFAFASPTHHNRCSSTRTTAALLVNARCPLQHERRQQQRRHYHHHHHRRPHERGTATTSLHLSIPRGGASAVATAASSAASKWSQLTSTPGGAFNAALAILAASTAAMKVYGSSTNNNSGEAAAEAKKKDPKAKSLQVRFLAVFWLLRMADWLQGPYFYQVYASKTFGGSASNAMTWVSRLFLTGFASTALFGPFIGRMVDSKGRRAGTLAFTVLYAIGALSTKSPLLGVLLFGRVMGGIGTSLLFSAPEAWLVGEAGREGVEDSLGETFGLAYAGDSIVAILAGQIAALAASSRGPTGPFELSVGFLVMGGLLASLMWKENFAGGGSGGEGESKPTIRDAVDVVKSDPKIMLVGAMQSLFEAAMYIFVLNWPPAVSKAVGSYFSKFSTDATAAGSAVGTPYGTVFSCFMACCLLGSTLFGQLTSSTRGVDAKTGKSKSVSTEKFAVGMLALATVSMGTAALSLGSSVPPFLATMASSSLPGLLTGPGAVLSVLMASLFLFESCVGMYFPTIGTLRSKYFPDSHRSVVMNLFGIPLNAMVVTVFLSIERLGVRGALGVSTVALAVATACGLRLKGLVEEDADGEKAGV